MGAVLRLIGHEFRARWLSWAVLVLLVGLAGGAVLAAAAGARRTDTAYPRFLQAYRASDVLVGPAGGGFGGSYDDALAGLPGVAAIAPIVGLQAAPLGPGGHRVNATVTAPLDDRFGHLLEVPKLLAGRQPQPGRPGDVMIDQIAAQDLHLRVGSRLEMGAAAGTGNGPIRRLSERVVGIAVDRGSVVPITDLDKTPVIVASNALFRELGPSYAGSDGAYVKLRPGVTVSGFSGRAQALTRQFPVTGGQIYLSDEAAQAAAVERSSRPQAVALALFALILAVTALLVVGQVATRLLLAAAADNGTLAALGMTRGQLLAAALVEVGAAAAAGAAVACGVAIAASPLMPIGPARLAEPDPGLNVNVPVLAAGFAATVILLVAGAAWPAWRLASARHSAERDAAGAPGRPSRAAEWLGRSGAPVTAVSGMRLALNPGQDWDVAVDLQFSTITPQRFDSITARVAGISSWTFGVHGTVQIGSGPRAPVVPAIGLAAGQGPLTSPTLLAGRSPRSRNEIALGTSDLRLLGLHVGQSVPVTAAGRRPLPARIVGRSVFPYFGQGLFTPTDLGQGAIVTAATLEPQSGAAGNGSGYNFVLVQFAPGPRRAADIAGFDRAMGPFCAGVEQSTCVVKDQRPNGVTGYARIDGTPEVLAGILAALGLAVLGQFAVASARRRRRDFAILRTLGLLRRQLTAITVWQVTALTGLALLVGLPLGVAAGHWAWGLFAGTVGLSAAAITPLPLVLLMIPAAIVAANAIALPSGRHCARLNPAAVLRSE